MAAKYGIRQAIIFSSCGFFLSIFFFFFCCHGRKTMNWIWCCVLLMYRAAFDWWIACILWPNRQVLLRGGGDRWGTVSCRLVVPQGNSGSWHRQRRFWLWWHGQEVVWPAVWLIWRGKSNVHNQFLCLACYKSHAACITLDEISGDSEFLLFFFAGVLLLFRVLEQIEGENWPGSPGERPLGW